MFRHVVLPVESVRADPAAAFAGTVHLLADGGGVVFLHVALEVEGAAADVGAAGVETGVLRWGVLAG